MFRRSSDIPAADRATPERVDSVLGAGVAWQGKISGIGGVRIEGAFDGEIALRGLVVIGERGRVTCEHIRAVTVVVAGSVKGDITAHKVEISRSGRVWGDVVTASFSTEEGAFLRGKITMEEQIDLGLGPEPTLEGEAEEESLSANEGVDDAKGEV
jgi:cytoskeletal protein CcmA (bactofilin family)